MTRRGVVLSSGVFVFSFSFLWEKEIGIPHLNDRILLRRGNVRLGSSCCSPFGQGAAG